MKTKTFILTFVSLFFLTGMFAQDLHLKFKIVNNSGVTLNGVYVSETVKEEWGEDIIPENYFPNNSTVEVSIPITDKTLCIYDIKITDRDDEGRVFPEIDFCEVSMITFFTGEDGDVYYKTE
ncbi:hypothetical protein [Lacinutrix chionoecetis]